MSKYKTTSESLVFPIKIDGKTLFIKHDAETEIDLKKCDHQTCLHLQSALLAKELVCVDEVKVSKEKLKVKGE